MGNTGSCAIARVSIFVTKPTIAGFTNYETPPKPVSPQDSRIETRPVFVLIVTVIAVVHPDDLENYIKGEMHRKRITQSVNGHRARRKIG